MAAHETELDLEQCWAVGVPNDVAGDFEEVGFEAACAKYGEYMQAAHAMFYALDNTVLWDKYKVHANILVSCCCPISMCSGFPAYCSLEQTLKVGIKVHKGFSLVLHSNAIR